MTFNQTMVILILFFCGIGVVNTGIVIYEWLQKNVKVAVKKFVIYVAQTYVSHRKNNTQNSVSLSKNIF